VASRLTVGIQVGTLLAADDAHDPVGISQQPAVAWADWSAPKNTARPSTHLQLVALEQLRERAIAKAMHTSSSAQDENDRRGQAAACASVKELDSGEKTARLSGIVFTKLTAAIAWAIGPLATTRLSGPEPMPRTNEHSDRRGWLVG
jgi:hypothetical protein